MALSVVMPELFPHDTVWSAFGRGYLFVPLVLPLLGMWWLILRPIVPAVGLIYAFGSVRSVETQTTVPYAVFFLSGSLSI